MAKVITRRWLRTSFTTSLFCWGVARQQTTAWQRAASSRNRLCRLSCRANSRVLPLIMSPARSPESGGAGGWCKASLDACSGEAGFFFWSSFKIVSISISQAFLKREAKTVSLGAPLLATSSYIYHCYSLTFASSSQPQGVNNRLLSKTSQLFHRDFCVYMGTG